MQETWVRSLSWEDPLEEGTATNSSILAWRIPWTEKRSLTGYNSWDHKELDTTEQLSTVHNIRRALNILEYKILKDMAVIPKHLKKMQI